MVRRSIVFTALALFAAGAAQAQPVTSRDLPPPGDDGGYDQPQPGQGGQSYRGQSYGTQQGYGAPADDQADPQDNPYADPAAGGTYDPSRRTTTSPTPLTGPAGPQQYSTPPVYGQPPAYGNPPPAYGRGAPPPSPYGARPAYGRPAPAPTPYDTAPGGYGDQGGVGSSCDDLAAELQRFRGPPSNPMGPRDQACAAARNGAVPGQPNTAFRECSDRFFQQYERKREEYKRCMEQDASKGDQRLDDRATTADAARNGYAGTAPQMAGPYARSGSPGWLGVQVAPVSPQAAYRTGAEGMEGAYVLNAVMNSPAQKAGLRRGDIIIGFDGQAIATPKDLQYQAERLSAGQQVRLDVLRGGQRMTLDVEITGRP